MALATSTMLGIALASTVVGTGISVYGNLAQAETTKNVAEYNAKVQENNAQIQRNNASVAVQQASIEANKKRKMKRSVAGSQAASAAKSGITISGSVSDVMYDSAVELENEALLDIYKGNVTAHGLEGSALGLEGQAAFTRTAGASSSQQSILGAAGSAFSGASSIAGLKYKYSTAPKIA